MPREPAITSTELLTRVEAARELRCSVRWLDARIACGELAVVRLGRRVLVRRGALQLFVAAREVASA